METSTTGSAVDRELPIYDATHLFVGKRIAGMDAECVNNVQFAFDDGSTVALHIDADSNGIPDVMACTSCTTINLPSPDSLTIATEALRKLSKPSRMLPVTCLASPDAAHLGYAKYIDWLQEVARTALAKMASGEGKA